jgi:hypothetical protein
VKALREEPARRERLVHALFREVHSIASLRARVEQPV